MPSSCKTLRKIKQSYTKFEKMLTKEVNKKMKRYCSPLFRETEPEFQALNQKNLFYGYRTKIMVDNQKTSLLTVSNKKLNR
jgi:hypothetical protein